MNGDFARITFDPNSHFTRVLLQQGRVLLEADFNEQSAIHHHFLRTLIVDVIGRSWRAGNGFQIVADPNNRSDFTITRGHFYIDGILCENDIDRTYLTQPWGFLTDAERELSNDGFMIFLECWERHISAVQRPSLREVALGGPDTATRAQIVWRVRTTSQDGNKKSLEQVLSALNTRLNVTTDVVLKAQVTNDINRVKKAIDDLNNAITQFPQGAPGCSAAANALDALDAALPRLRARASHDARNDDPCAIAADAEYRSRENQLYRVEVHTPGLADGTATFKWSRENACVLFGVRGSVVMNTAGDTITVKLDSLGHDRRTGLCEGDWVELTGDAFEFMQSAPPLGQITHIDRARRSVSIKLGVVSNLNFASCTLLKRWDQRDDLNTGGTIVIQESTSDSTGWFALERGVEVQFLPGGVYRTGDYWLIPARVASHDVEWPQADLGPAAVPPHGIRHHRTAIGLGKKTGNTWTYGSCGCTLQPLCPS